MEASELLRMQNRFIDALSEDEKMTKLKKFNEELIERIEFEKEHPFVFSERIVRILVKHGFQYRGYSHGKNKLTYELSNPICTFMHGYDGVYMYCFFKNSVRFDIENESDFTEELLLQILIRAEVEHGKPKAKEEEKVESVLEKSRWFKFWRGNS